MELAAAFTDEYERMAGLPNQTCVAIGPPRTRVCTRVVCSRPAGGVEFGLSVQIPRGWPSSWTIQPGTGYLGPALQERE
jgi:hypothetical protein